MEHEPARDPALSALMKQVRAEDHVADEIRARLRERLSVSHAQPPRWHLAARIATLLAVVGTLTWLALRSAAPSIAPPAMPAQDRVLLAQSTEPSPPSPVPPSQPSLQPSPEIQPPIARPLLASKRIPAPPPAHVDPLPLAPEPVPESELALLQRARLALAHDASEALSLSEQHRRMYASSAYAEEREVIAIRALIAARRSEQAEQALERFAQRYPSSFATPLLRRQLEPR